MEPLDILLTLAVKGAVLLSLAAIVSLSLARQSAALRHVVWCIGLIGLLLLPVLDLMVPNTPLPRWNRTAPAVEVAQVAPVASPDAAPAPAFAATGAAAAVVEASPAIPAPASPRWPEVMPLMIVGVWVGGGVVLLLLLALGHARAARLAARASRDVSLEWEALIAEAADQAGLRDPFRVRETDDLTVPVTVGLLHPVVLVPVEGRSWSEAHRRDVLIHEFAHVRRHDCLTHTLGWIACACHWLNPLGWIALWRLRMEREQACDDMVLRAGARPSHYAGELLHTAHLASLPFAVGATGLTMARRSQLATRLLAILDARRARGPLRPVAVLTCGFLAAFVILPIASLTPAAAVMQRDARPWEEVAVPGSTADGRGAPTLPVAAQAVVAVRPSGVGATLFPPQDPVLCAPSERGQNRTVRVNRSMSFTGAGTADDGKGNTWVVWSGPDCSVTIHLVGRVRFNAAEEDVESLSADGRFEATHSVGDRERRYLVRMRNGGLERMWYMDDRPTEPDAEALRWRAAIVLEYIRRSGYDAEARTRRILAASGVDGVLEEIRHIGGDWASARYFTALIEAARLDDNAAARVVSAASQQIESDHYLAEILGALPATLLNGDRTLAAYLSATEGLESDHYLSEVLTRVLGTSALRPAATRALLQRSARMESDHYLATLLVGLAGTGVVQGDLLPSYLDAARGIESDHYKAQVLGQLVPEFAGQPELLAAALRTAGTIESDHYLGEYLKQVLTARALAGPAIEPFFAAVRTIESDHYRAEVLIAALGRSSDGMVVTRALEASPDIESDHYLAEVLLAARQRGLTEAQQALWRRAADAIESEHYRERVLREGRESGGREARQPARSME